MKVLVTGAAGFIGFHTCMALIERGYSVIGIDNVNDYYDVGIKQERLRILCEKEKSAEGQFEFKKIDIAKQEEVFECFKASGFEKVIHLAAQAGVRYSLENPMAYVDSNIVGFTNILEACRAEQCKHLVYASTSSVYGANTNMPFDEDQGVDHPLQFYAATKRANELMAHSYSHLYGLPTTGLRFFTVYGPWGRPDMALFLFTRNIIAGKPIDVFNNGQHTRDFTYVSDIAEGIVLSMERIAKPDPQWDSDTPNPSTSNAPFKILNIGNSSPIKLGEYIEAIEVAVGKSAIRNMLPLQPGDVPDTFANVGRLQEYVGYKPNVGVPEGVTEFVNWYREYFGV